MISKPDNAKLYTVVATNASLNFQTSSQVIEMLDPHASYQVIPSVPEVFDKSVWDIIVDLLPKTEYIFYYVAIFS
jgi:hypothetical protein